MNFSPDMAFYSNIRNPTSLVRIKPYPIWRHPPPSRPPITSRKAVVLQRFGGPEVMELRESFRVPNLLFDEVLVRAHAVSINPIDLYIRADHPVTPTLAHILGQDVSGEVVEWEGRSFRALRIGQEVFGACFVGSCRGTYMDYAIMAEEELTQKPRSWTHECPLASCLLASIGKSFVAMTAWSALQRTAEIRAGQRALVIGGGPEGFAAIQLAVANRCHFVFMCGNQEIDRALAAGVDQALDCTAEDVELALKGEFDAVLDTIAEERTEIIGLNILKLGGHYMTIEGINHYQKMTLLDYSSACMEPDKQGLVAIQRLSVAGRLHIPVDKTFPITQVREAHEAIEKGQICGKVVLKLH